MVPEVLNQVSNSQSFKVLAYFGQAASNRTTPRIGEFGLERLPFAKADQVGRQEFNVVHSPKKQFFSLNIQHSPRSSVCTWAWRLVGSWRVLFEGFKFDRRPSARSTLCYLAGTRIHRIQHMCLASKVLGTVLASSQLFSL